MKINTNTLEISEPNTKMIAVVYDDSDYNNRIGRISKYTNGKYVGFIKGKNRTGKVNSWEQAIKKMAKNRRTKDKNLYFTFTKEASVVY